MQKVFTLEEIIRVTRGRLVSGEKGFLFVPARKVCTDSRQLKRGDLFIALIGEHFDGHNFVKEAWKRGACGAVVSRLIPSLPPTFPLIRVRDTLRALQELARFHRQRLSSVIVGITGSNGKTTAKEMAFEILSRRYPTLKSEGNLNNQIGVPLTLFNLLPRHRVAVLEMGMNSPGEIGRLAEIIQPNVGVITNIHRSHIGPLGGLEAVKEAKAELIPYLNGEEDNHLVLNGDDNRVRELKERARCRVITFGVGDSCDVRAEDIQEREEQMSFTLIYGKDKIAVDLPVAGRYNVYNALAASAIALVLRVPFELIAEGLFHFKLPRLHGQITNLGEYRLINDSYNANPESMKEALNLLSRLRGRRKIAVLGDMLELGEKARAAHREVGMWAGRLGIDALYCLGELSREMTSGAVETGVRDVFSFDEGDELVDKLTSYLESGDCLLIKGSRGMRMEEIEEKLRMSLCSPT